MEKYCWLLWIPFLRFFHHEHFSVLLKKGKDWYALFIYIFSLMKNIFFLQNTQFLYGIVWFWQARRFLCQCWPLSMTEEGLPPTFFSIIILMTHAHLASLLLNTICFTSLATWRVSGPLQWSLPSAVTHLQSLTTGLCPGTRQFIYFCRSSTSIILALNSLSV
jgi:hypothetical protein